MFDALPAGHPFAATLSVADMKLKLNIVLVIATSFLSLTDSTMQNSESGRKINQAVNTTSRAVGGTIFQAQGAFSSLWSSITSAAGASERSGADDSNGLGHIDEAVDSQATQEISVTFKNHKDEAELDIAYTWPDPSARIMPKQLATQQPQGIVEIGREDELLVKVEQATAATTQSQSLRRLSVDRSSGDVFNTVKKQQKH